MGTLLFDEGLDAFVAAEEHECEHVEELGEGEAFVDLDESVDDEFDVDSSLCCEGRRRGDAFHDAGDDSVREECVYDDLQCILVEFHQVFKEVNDVELVIKKQLDDFVLQAFAFLNLLVYVIHPIS